MPLPWPAAKVNAAKVRAVKVHAVAMRAVLGLVLALLTAPAFALGLGQLVVKSRPGEPLLAEIPIISSDPAELHGLEARLASAETFSRIGLEPPQGLVTDLVFTPVVSESGQPVIRVTSTAPVQQAALTFLLEVNWAQGRLVREYSALVDGPRSVATPATPQIEAPVALSAPVIERPASPFAVEPAPQPAATPQAPAAPTPAPAPIVAAPVPEAAQPAEPAAPPATAQASAETKPAETKPATPTGQLGRVKRGETLSAIASALPANGDYTLNQTMLALLQANPEAFIGQDINRLREGAVLRMPGEDAFSRYSANQATALVREQVANWRASRRAQAQPATADGQAQAATDAGKNNDQQGSDPQGNKKPADARLEIAPPGGSDSARPGTQSGATAGGEGEMLRQELQQTKENLAARDAEVAELKSRLAELERLQKDQQGLIEMKDSALANAQQRLASTQADATANQNPASGIGWWWLLVVALVVGALAWWFGRRRADRGPVAAATPRLSDRMAAETAIAAGAVASTSAAADAAPASTPKLASAETDEAAPQWVGRASPITAPPAPFANVGTTPTWMGAPAADVSVVSPINSAPAGSDRLELARAYLQMGDTITARSLLQEVAAGDDARAREEATRLLQTMH